MRPAPQPVVACHIVSAKHRDNEQPALFASNVAEAADRGPELEASRRMLEASGRYVVLEKLLAKKRFSEQTPASNIAVRRGVYLDVETTGLDSGDGIIELALIGFEYDDDGHLYRVLDTFDQFEDPGRPLPKEITALTGITDADVRGTRLDVDAVASIVAPADLVIAHNAGFDRPFVERRLPLFRDKAWACSVTDIDWGGLGFSSRSLEFLAMKHGFAYDGHRAINDCWAGLELLSRRLDGRVPTMARLLDSASRTVVRLWALGSPFDAKDLLKARSYRWNAPAKTWWRDVPSEEHETELAWLASSVYRHRPPLPYLEITPQLRYSDRVSEDPPRDVARR